LNRPLILAALNNGVAVDLALLPSRAEARGISFQVPELLPPDVPRGSRVIVPSGMKFILNLVPPCVDAVKGWPMKKVA
jgi:hypothetical protein